MNEKILLLFKTNVLIILCLLSSCSHIMPGMRNPNMANVKRIAYKDEVKVIPTLIPITNALIAHQHTEDYIYYIAPADILNISVWQHPEFSAPEQSNQVTNLPSTQGAAGKEGYLVNHKGEIYFPLLGKLSVAGKSVDDVRIELTKKLRKYVKKPNINVRVVDFRGKKVYVLGEVMKPGFVPLNDQPLSITDAIVLTGGLDPNAADPQHIFVIRGNLYKRDIYWLNAETPDNLILAEYFTLKPGDVLFVSSAPATRWNRVLNQLLPSIQTIWYTKSVIDNG